MSRRTLLRGAVALLIIVGMVFASRGLFSSSTSATKSDKAATFEVKRGDLVVDVLEGGNIHALQSLEIRNEVKTATGTKILSIIEEGYEVTDDDIESGKVLVQLDASAVEEQIVDHDVEFQETQAEYAEAKQNIEIQASENISEVKLVRQYARFALLDFEKFVGAKAAREILQSLDLPYDAATLEAFEADADAMILTAFDSTSLLEDVAVGGDLGDQDDDDASRIGDRDTTEALAAVAAEVAAENEAAAKAADPLQGGQAQNGSRASGVDFTSFLEGDRLGEGEAEQTMRRMQDEFLVARTELAVVEESVEGAIRLHKEDFITTTTLENEKVALEKARLTVKTAETELELFRDYEFPKEAEKMLSLFEEALLELVREKREAMAQAVQAETRYRSRKRRYELELAKRDDLQRQLESCVIRAQKAGLVAYGGANDNYYTSRYYEAISEGATLKTGQPIITIPDMARLAVDVNIHESHIKSVQLGQEARISVDAVPDQTLTGRVTKVAVLPDSNASRYNPSLKVYPATIEIDGAHDWLKPGMTAKVEIIVSELENVVFVPVQSIFVENDQHFVFVDEGGRKKQRPVTVGDHNDEFIEILAGVEEGDSILLTTPDEFEVGEFPVEMEAAQVGDGDDDLAPKG